MTTPQPLDDPLYELLKQEDIEAFNNARKANPEVVSLRGGDFRGLDLRGMVADGLDLRDCYFRGADLRGIDFRRAHLEGASIAGTKISGCYFSHLLPADEIMMSVTHGTRLRYHRSPSPPQDSSGS